VPRREAHCAQPQAARLLPIVRRFGSALNLNIHFHLPLLDGAYRIEGVGASVFHPVSEPRAQEL
jgi:hypothetical protein